MNGKLELNGEEVNSLHEVLELIYRQRVTGSIMLILHCHSGVPRAADVGRYNPRPQGSQRIEFDLPSRKGLDNNGGSPPT